MNEKKDDARKATERRTFHMALIAVLLVVVIPIALDFGKTCGWVSDPLTSALTACDDVVAVLFFVFVGLRQH